MRSSRWMAVPQYFKWCYNLLHCIIWYRLNFRWPMALHTTGMCILTWHRHEDLLGDFHLRVMVEVQPVRIKPTDNLASSKTFCWCSKFTDLMNNYTTFRWWDNFIVLYYDVDVTGGVDKRECSGINWDFYTKKLSIRCFMEIMTKPVDTHRGRYSRACTPSSSFQGGRLWLDPSCCRSETEN